MPTTRTLTDPVGPSRDGDAFHYRWAARRCLRLLSPDRPVEFITIEGASPDEASRAGDLIIDVAEYTPSVKGVCKVDYYQLKHSTRRVASPMPFSNFTKTFEGFGAKFADRMTQPTETRYEPRSFTIVTNRRVSSEITNGLSAIVADGTRMTSKVNALRRKLQKATGLLFAELKQFCKLLRIVDAESDYIGQKQKLAQAVGALLSERPPDETISHLIDLVSSQALSNGRRKLSREDVLHALGVQSEDELFPAPPRWESLPGRVSRICYDKLVRDLQGTNGSVIVQAAGGVGKSTFCQHFFEQVPPGSICIGYDCFGRGDYRRPSKPRHLCSQGFIQLTNELALRGLCSIKLPNSRLNIPQLTRAFLASLTEAVESIRQRDPKGALFLLIDAADNAAKIAQEKNEDSFPRVLLQEQIPDGCILVFLSRPERVHLLGSSESIPRHDLPAFIETESLAHLRTIFPEATVEDGREFHRLTSANPRVQAVYLSSHRDQTLKDLLRSLGNTPVTLEEHFSRTLRHAMQELPGKTGISAEEVNQICTGLAFLPPAIPMSLLAQLAGVSVDTIRSFITDLSRPMVEYGDFVQFRDEPTETWFRTNYVATPKEISVFCHRIMAETETSAYASEILPSLLHKSGQDDAVIELALSNRHLPKQAIASKQIVQKRLQFAIRSAISRQQWTDAARVAMRAGEGVASQERLFELLAANTDLAAALMPPEGVRELAFRRTLKSFWRGSFNLYTASLLLQLSPEHAGEAASYLRSTYAWIRIHLAANKQPEYRHEDFRLAAGDLAEIASCLLLLKGPAEAGKLFRSIDDQQTVFTAMAQICSRLIDRGAISKVEALAVETSTNAWCALAVCLEYEAIGRYPDRAFLEDIFRFLLEPTTSLPESSYDMTPTSLQRAVLAATEGGFRAGAPPKVIEAVLDLLVPKRAAIDIWRHGYMSEWRHWFFRAAALRARLHGLDAIDIQSLVPEKWMQNDKLSSEDRHWRERFIACGRRVGPWFMMRLASVEDPTLSVGPLIAKALAAMQNFQMWDSHQTDHEIAAIRLDLLLRTPASETAPDGSSLSFISRTSHPGFIACCRALRATHYLPSTTTLRLPLEMMLRSDVQAMRLEDGPDQTAGSYLNIARAVFMGSRNDAESYFLRAVEITEKSGEEVVFRWSALVSLARKAVIAPTHRSEVAFRYWKCAEMIGDHVQREKYWDRHEAIQIGVQLHPASALAAISRWHDRGVGHGEYLNPLARELLAAQAITGEEAWPFSRFISCNNEISFTEACLRHTKSPEKAQAIFDQAVIEYGYNVSPPLQLERLLQIGESLRLQTDCCRNAVELNRALPIVAKRDEADHFQMPDADPQSYQEYIQDGKIDTVAGVLDLARNFEGLRPRNPSIFYRALFQAIAVDLLPGVLNAIAQDPAFTIYDFPTILTALGPELNTRMGVRDNWPMFYHLVGRTHARSLLGMQDMQRFFKYTVEDPVLAQALRQGLLNAISSSEDDLGSESLYGLVRFLAQDLPNDVAADQLAAGIERFEKFYNQDMGDGTWSDAYIPPNDLHSALAGYLWAALGSPTASVRWQATHALRLAGEGFASKIVESVIPCFSSSDAGAFCNKNHPFYIEYAKLHALIAIARLAKEGIRLSAAWKIMLLTYSSAAHPHLLQRHFAAQAILHAPDQFTGEQVHLAKSACRSAFPPHKSKTSFHGEGMHGNHPMDALLTYDFEKHWIRPLSRRFRLTTEEVKTQLMTEIQGHFQINPAEPLADPRQPWINRLQRSGKGHASWDDCPSLSSYGFYLCEQAFDRVHARLLATKPMEWDQWDDPSTQSWEARLGYRTLVRNDGRWASDRRQPIPMTQAALYRNVIAWCEKGPRPIVSIHDLILSQVDGDDFLAIAGHLTVRHLRYSVHVHLSCGLVAAGRSQSLLHSLTSYQNPDDYRLPDAGDDDATVEHDAFVLRGIVGSKNICPGIDKHDPFSNDLLEYPYLLDAHIAQRLGISSDEEHPKIRCSQTGKVILSLAAWGGGVGSEDDEAEKASFCSGRVTALHRDHMLALCRTDQMHLLVRVQVSYRSRESNAQESKETTHEELQELFLFTPDGMQHERADPRVG